MKENDGLEADPFVECHNWKPGMAFRYIGDNESIKHEIHYFVGHTPVGPWSQVFIGYTEGRQHIHWHGFPDDYERWPEHDKLYKSDTRSRPVDAALKSPPECIEGLDEAIKLGPRGPGVMGTEEYFLKYNQMPRDTIIEAARRYAALPHCPDGELLKALKKIEWGKSPGKAMTWATAEELRDIAREAIAAAEGK